MAVAVGIDLGTTNSVVAVAGASGIRLAIGARGERVHPSVVSFPERGGVLVGGAAAPKKATDASNTIHSAKRLIGQNVKAPLVQLAIASLAYRVEEGKNQQPLVLGGGRRMTVPDVSALVLGHLKQLAEEQFADEVSEAVITVPANFSDAQRQATKEAGRIAGLEVMRLINEPTAAALAYGYGQRLEEIVAVFDFGGGTFDVSVLEIRSDIFEVLATDGEFFLGGDDLDRAIAEHLAAEMNRQHGIDPRNVPEAMNRLYVAAERIKCYLSESDEAGGSVDGIVLDERGEPVAVDFHITRQQFERLIGGYVDRTMEVCRQALVTAGVEPRAVSDIILVGGSTRIPLIRSRVAELFGREPAAHINPDEVVAHGAAIQAASLSSHQVPRIPASSRAGRVSSSIAIDERPSALLLDVTPATLGIGTVGGYAEVLLAKNSPIPIEHSRVFTTAHDRQTRVVIDCCRGESKRFADNEVLGTLVLDDVPPAPRGEAMVEVTFRVDADGILHVRARDVQSGQAREATLEVIGAPVPAGGHDADRPR